MLWRGRQHRDGNINQRALISPFFIVYMLSSISCKRIIFLSITTQKTFIMNTGSTEQVYPHYELILTRDEVKARIERARIEDAKIRPLMDKVKKLLLKLN